MKNTKNIKRDSKNDLTGSYIDISWNNNRISCMEMGHRPTGGEPFMRVEQRKANAPKVTFDTLETRRQS